MSDADAIAGGQDALVGQLQRLQLQAAQQYEPVVDALLRTGSRDVQQIEHTLDGLLDFFALPALAIGLDVVGRGCRVDVPVMAAQAPVHLQHGRVAAEVEQAIEAPQTLVPISA